VCGKSTTERSEQNTEEQTDQNSGVKNKRYKNWCSSKRIISLDALVGIGKMMLFLWVGVGGGGT